MAQHQFWKCSWAMYGFVRACPKRLSYRGFQLTSNLKMAGLSNSPKTKWSMESCWCFFHNHFYKSLFEDVFAQKDFSWLAKRLFCVKVPNPPYMPVRRGSNSWSLSPVPAPAIPEIRRYFFDPKNLPKIHEIRRVERSTRGDSFTYSYWSSWKLTSIE